MDILLSVYKLGLINHYIKNIKGYKKSPTQWGEDNGRITLPELLQLQN
jgi:hypothetical protein